MSAESAHHINGKRGVAAGVPSRRPATRIAFGILIAFAYVAILAGAGFFISGAVNSMNENTVVARAAIDAFREPARSGADPAGSGTSDAQSAQAVPATAPWRPPAAPPLSPPRGAAPAAPESPTPAAPTAAPADSSRAMFAPPADPPAGDAARPPYAAPAAAPASAAPVVAPAVAGGPIAAPAAPDEASSREFLARGDERIEQGDVASARLFFERAADAGSALAARRLGNSFDPTFLARWGARFMRADPAEAARWYRRADTLGDGEAAQDLAALPQH